MSRLPLTLQLTARSSVSIVMIFLREILPFGSCCERVAHGGEASQLR